MLILIFAMRRTDILLTDTAQVGTTVMPFVTPKTNNVRNSKRYGLASSVLRNWLRETLEKNFSGVSQSLVPLFAFSDNMDIQSQKGLVICFGQIRTWFLNWVATGSRERGVVAKKL